MHRTGLESRSWSTGRHEPFMEARNDPFTSTKDPYSFDHPISNDGNHPLQFT